MFSHGKRRIIKCAGIGLIVDYGVHHVANLSPPAKHKVHGDYVASRESRLVFPRLDFAAVLGNERISGARCLFHSVHFIAVQVDEIAFTALLLSHLSVSFCGAFLPATQIYSPH